MLCSREIFNFLIRKDVKKILKRKDSDAGQREGFLTSLDETDWIGDEQEKEKTQADVDENARYSMAKIAVTPSIVLAEFICYKKKVTFSKVNVENNANHFAFSGFYDSFP
ncbi:putative membrane protein isoform X1 [Gossypium australe]|uniref:Putative membrane protein isoform X1 n=1 Tax=Gossypium australe TaxID=47621 RepID=A0A5B6XA46_9ROSI|nr:putative membrane protein isoform X1 [Gossypium australe]